MKLVKNQKFEILLKSPYHPICINIEKSSLVNKNQMLFDVHSMFVYTTPNIFVIRSYILANTFNEIK